jgi:hypothetical protein
MKAMVIERPGMPNDDGCRPARANAQSRRDGARSGSMSDHFEKLAGHRQSAIVSDVELVDEA